MLEDILLIGEHHRKAAEAIMQVIEENRTPKFIVAISGESGSGKSELTHVIAKELFRKGIVAKPIHIDNFYQTLPLGRNSWRLEHGVEKVVGPGEYDWGAINIVIKSFQQGTTCSMPCVDLVTQRVDRLTTDFSEIEVLVIDGLYAVKTPGVNLAVMIDLTYHETKKAQSSRGKENTDEFRFRVLEAEHQAVQALRPLAHLFISKEYKVYEAQDRSIQF
jgi:uridine kinase